jgi:hypothetical protein
MKNGSFRKNKDAQNDVQSFSDLVEQETDKINNRENRIPYQRIRSSSQAHIYN